MTQPAVAVAPVDDRFVPAESVGPVPPNYYCRAWNGHRQKYCRSRSGAGTDHLGDGRCRIHGGSRAIKHGLGRRYEFKTTRIRELVQKHADDPNPLDIRPEIDLLRALAEDYIDRYDERLNALAAWYAQRHIDADQGKALYDLIDEYEGMIRDQPVALTEEQTELLNLARKAVQHLGEDVCRPANVPDVADASRIVAEITRAVERIHNMGAKTAITYEQLKRFLFAIDRILQSRVKDADVLTQIQNDILGVAL